ncbi:MAG: response regulator transcription factor [Caldilineaceae bacterium]
MKAVAPQPNRNYSSEASNIFPVSSYWHNQQDPRTSGQILVIEGHETLRRSLAIALKFEGYQVFATGNADMIWPLLAAHKISLVLIDVDQPLPNGHAFCVGLRKRSNVPIVVVSAKRSTEALITWLNLGADAYLSKPFPIQVLSARIRALLRRMNHQLQNQSGAILTFGDITLDENRHEVIIRGRLVELSPSEYSLLAHLMRNPGKLIRKEEIQEVLWHYQPGEETSSVRVNIRRLRRKIERDPAHPYYLKTVYGQGYQFAEVNL